VKAGHYGDFDSDITKAVIEEAGRFAGDVLAPLNRKGDTEGARYAIQAGLRGHSPLLAIFSIVTLQVVLIRARVRAIVSPALFGLGFNAAI